MKFLTDKQDLHTRCTRSLTDLQIFFKDSFIYTLIQNFIQNLQDLKRKICTFQQLDTNIVTLNEHILSLRLQCSWKTISCSIIAVHVVTLSDTIDHLFQMYVNSLIDKDYN